MKKTIVILLTFISILSNSQTINNNSYEWTKAQRFDKFVDFKDSTKHNALLFYKRTSYPANPAKNTIINYKDTLKVYNGSSWDILGSNILAGNGLYLDGDTIKLGGAITETTNIDADKSIYINGTGATPSYFWFENGNAVNGFGVQVNGTADIQTDSCLFRLNSSGTYSSIFQDNTVRKQGISYAGDYTATLKNNARSIPDVATVRNIVHDSIGNIHTLSGSQSIKITGDSVYLNDTIYKNTLYLSNALKAKYYKLDTTVSVPSYQKGTIYWDTENRTMAVQVGDNVTLQVGQEMNENVQNNSGALIENGKAVYVYDAGGEIPRIRLADNRYIPTAYKMIGVATQDIAHGSQGKVTTYGKVHDLNTYGLIEGNDIYLSTSGNWTQTKPTAAHIIKLGSVRYAHSSNGIIEVNIHRESMPAFKILDYDANSGLSLDTTGITQFSNSVTKFSTDVSGNITTGNYQGTSIDTTYTNAISNVTAVSPLSVVKYGKTANIRGTNLIVGNGSGTDNQLATYTGTNAIQNEAALTYNGTNLINTTASGNFISPQFSPGTSTKNRPIWTTSALLLDPTNTIGWSASANVGGGSDDVEIGRDAANILGVYTTFQRTGVGWLKAKLIIPNASLVVTPLANYFENDGTNLWYTDNAGSPVRHNIINTITETKLTPRRIPIATTNGNVKDTTGLEFTNNYFYAPNFLAFGNIGAGATTPLHRIVGVCSRSSNLNAFNFTLSNLNVNRTTVVQATDTSSIYANFSYTGSPKLEMKSKTGASLFKADSSGISANVSGTNAYFYNVYGNLGNFNAVSGSGVSLIANNGNGNTSDIFQAQYFGINRLTISAAGDITQRSISGTSKIISWGTNVEKGYIDSTGKAVISQIVLSSGGTSAGKAPLKFTTQASGLSTVEQGAMEMIGNTLQFTNLAVRRSIVQNVKILTSDVSVTNTTTETEIWSIPHGANYLEIGKKENSVLQGTINSVSGAGANTLTIRIKYAGTTYATFVIPELARTTQNIEIHAMTTCRAIGNGTTSIQIHARSEIDNEANDATVNILATGLNSTVAQSTTITAEWSDASANNSLVILQGEGICVDPAK